MSDSSLRGRTALVTGGAKGIGRACCVRLARAGAHVAINYLTSELQARETADLVAEAGATPHLVCADVSSAEQVQAMVGDVTESLGPIDIGRARRAAIEAIFTMRPKRRWIMLCFTAHVTR